MRLRAVPLQNTADEADLATRTASALRSGTLRMAKTKLLRTAWWKFLVRPRRPSLDPSEKATDAQCLNCVLEVAGLCITKLLDLFMLQGARSAELMCDESYI